jgi:hypothetical protein
MVIRSDLSARLTPHSQDNFRHHVGHQAILFFAAVLAFRAAALPVTESHDDAWSSCSSSFSAYSSSWSEYELPYTTTIYTTTYETELYSFEQPLTTLCDGRERGNGPYSRYWTETSEELDPPLTTTLSSIYQEPYPSCTEFTDAATRDAAVQTFNPDSVLFPRADQVACPGPCSIAAQGNP